MDILEQIDKYLDEENEFFKKAINIKGHKVKFVSLGKSMTAKVRVYLDGKKFGDFKNSKMAQKEIEKEIK